MSSTLLSLIKMKCPRCHRGKLFLDPNPYHFANLTKMPENCPVCGQLTQPEPAFYYGAMYVSYGISITLGFINYFIVELLFGISGVGFLTINTIILILLWPVIFRYARVIYIYIFVRYDSGYKDKTN